MGFLLLLPQFGCCLSFFLLTVSLCMARFQSCASIIQIGGGLNLKVLNWIMYKQFKHHTHQLKIFTSCCNCLHNFGIIHTSTRFWQATIRFSSSLANKPYKNNPVLILVVFIATQCCFWSVFSMFWTLPGCHCANPLMDEEVTCVILLMLHTDCLGTYV